MVNCNICGFKINKIGTCQRNTKYKTKHVHASCLERKLSTEKESLKRFKK